MASKLLFFILIIGFVAVAFVIKNKATFPVTFTTPTKTPQATQTSTGITSLTLSPTNTIILPSQRNTIHVIFDSPKNISEQPEIIQMEIAYDQEALLDIALQPGDFLKTNNPSQYNQPKNRSYLLCLGGSNEEQKQTSGIVAVIIFTPNPAFAGRETELSFLPKSIISGETDKNVLTATYGTKLTFGTSEQK